jgi:hypothetical protein
MDSLSDHWKKLDLMLWATGAMEGAQERW